MSYFSKILPSRELILLQKQNLKVREFNLDFRPTSASVNSLSNSLCPLRLGRARPGRCGPISSAGTTNPFKGSYGRNPPLRRRSAARVEHGVCSNFNDIVRVTVIMLPRFPKTGFESGSPASRPLSYHDILITTARTEGKAASSFCPFASAIAPLAHVPVSRPGRRHLKAATWQRMSSPARAESYDTLAQQREDST